MKITKFIIAPTAEYSWQAEINGGVGHILLVGGSTKFSSAGFVGVYEHKDGTQEINLSSDAFLRKAVHDGCIEIKENQE